MEYPEKNKYYTITDIHKKRWFPWINTYITMKNFIKRKIRNGNKRLKVITAGSNTASRYLIKGMYIIKMMEAEKNGQLHEPIRED